MKNIVQFHHTAIQFEDAPMDVKVAVEKLIKDWKRFDSVGIKHVPTPEEIKAFKERIRRK